MALASSGITTSLVGNTLGISNRNVGGLCTSSNVNPWSKWKPATVKDKAVRCRYTVPVTFKLQ